MQLTVAHMSVVVYTYRLTIRVSCLAVQGFNIHFRLRGIRRQHDFSYHLSRTHLA